MENNRPQFPAYSGLSSLQHTGQSGTLYGPGLQDVKRTRRRSGVADPWYATTTSATALVCYRGMRQSIAA